MNHFTIATKIWNSASPVIRDNCTLEDVQIFVKDSGIKGVANNEVALIGAIMRNLEYKRVQARKNAAENEHQRIYMEDIHRDMEAEFDRAFN